MVIRVPQQYLTHVVTAKYGNCICRNQNLDYEMIALPVDVID